MNIKLLFLVAALILLLIGCTTDLSKRTPYLEALGKEFVLQQDLYIYYCNDYDEHSWLSFPSKLRLGITTNLPATFDYDLPRTVEEKYIGAKNSYVTLQGILWKGTTVTIKRIIKRKAVDNVYYFYLISPTQGDFAGQEINPSDLINIFENPPYSKTWSDPPIFDPKYALPLPADGIWWK